jgi:hypothetical protein
VACSSLSADQARNSTNLLVIAYRPYARTSKTIVLLAALALIVGMYLSAVKR